MITETKQQHPGKRLYRQWRSALAGVLDENEFRTGVGIAYGRSRDHGISHWDEAGDKPEHIAFGNFYGHWHKVSGPFLLRPDGTFQLNHAYGWKQRDHIARNTFLQWSNFMGKYQWRVNESAETGDYDRYHQHWATNGTLRVRYRLEWLFLGNGWNNPGAWSDLKWTDYGWDIVPTKQAMIDRPWLYESYAWHDALREKRWERARKAHLVAIGELPPPRARQQLTWLDRMERAERVAETIAAQLTVETPANNRRSRKETTWLEPSGHA